MKILMATAKTLKENPVFGSGVPLCQGLPERWTGLSPYRGEGRFAAGDLYDGMAFRALGREHWDEKTWERARRDLILLSALYGPVRVHDALRPYRLDFKMAGRDWARIWTEQVRLIVPLLFGDEPVLDLASKEFSGPMTGLLKNRIVTVEFFQKAGDELKRHSTLSKKGRGELAGTVLRAGTSCIDEVRNLVTPSGFAFDSSRSKDDCWVFIMEK